jgi:hypothetical protein
MMVRVGADIFRRNFLKSPKQVLTCLNMCICKYIYTVNGACFILYWGGTYQRCGRGDVDVGDQISTERSEQESQREVRSLSAGDTRPNILYSLFIAVADNTTGTFDDGQRSGSRTDNQYTHSRCIKSGDYWRDHFIHVLYGLEPKFDRKGVHLQRGSTLLCPITTQS